MSNAVRVKICGLTTPETVAASVAAGAAYIGFNFFPKSPRYVSPEIAARLSLEVPPGVCKVALTVNASDDQFDQILDVAPIDMLQLHGGESAKRVIELKQRFGLPVMKVLGVAEAGDLDAIETYSAVADQILIDAKAPKGSILPGGNGVAFDWRLIANRRWSRPWMLAGGLTPANVSEAIALTSASQVDVASGVESQAGVKDVGKIQAFIAAAG